MPTSTPTTKSGTGAGTECPAVFRYNADNLYSATYDAMVANFNANISISTPNYYIADKPKITLAQAMTNSSSSKVYRV